MEPNPRDYEKMAGSVKHTSLQYGIIKSQSYKSFIV